MGKKILIIKNESIENPAKLFQPKQKSQITKK